MSATNDFSQLASLGLPTVSGGNGDNAIPSWNRSLRELQVASDSLLSSKHQLGGHTSLMTSFGLSSGGAGDGGAGDPNGSAGNDVSTAIVISGGENLPMSHGRRLPELGRLTGDLVATTRTGAGDNNNMSTTGIGNSTSQNGFVSEEETIRRHEINILDRILTSQQQATHQRSQELLEKQLQNDWEKTRGLWLDQLVGTRMLGGVAVNGSVKASGTNSTIQGENFIASSLMSNNSGNNVKPINPQMIQSHLEVVGKFNRDLYNNKGGEDNSPVPTQLVMETITNLQKISDPVSETAWSLMASIIDRTSSSPSSQMPIQSSNSTNSPIQNAVGAIILLCGQFQTLILNRVRNANSAGQDISVGNDNQASYMSGLANTIASFVKLELGSTTTSSAESSYWPQLYYCLRSGDAIAAKEILDAAAANHNCEVDAPIIEVVNELAVHQSSQVCFWLEGPPVISAQHRRNVADLYERSKNMTGSNMHKIGSLSLLSGSYELPTSDRVTGFSTIEDYLFGALCCALQHPSNDPKDQLARLGHRIRHFGPNHFEDRGESGGWSYALPLLICQQYRTALLHLADNGGPTGLLQATHLGLILSFAGIPVTDLVASNQDNANRQASSDSESCLVTALIIAYSTLLHAQPANSGGSLPSLEYLVRIPNKTRVRKEVASLIMRSPNDVSRLVGVLSVEGKRQSGSGALDSHFSQTEVSSILVETAEILLKDRNDNNKCQTAALLYMLAGHYRSLIGLLNQLISPPENLDEKRSFWLEQTKSFHATYLEKRTHVLEVLEKEENLDMISTSRILMGLHTFFQHYYRGAFDEAWNVLFSTSYDQQGRQQYQLDLLPKSKSDVSSKESRFHGLDPLVQKTYPMILKCAMDILNHQHRRVKSELQVLHHNGGDASYTSAARQRLMEIKETASLFISFAGLLPNIDNNHGEYIDTMSRMEALMV